MKKIILGAMIAVAAFFTGCEDAKEVTSCDLRGEVMRYSVHVCFESDNDDYVRQACFSKNTRFLGPSSTINSAVVSSGCGNGAQMVCTSVQNGIEFTFYGYGSLYSEADCKDYQNFAH
jgi:hypothetical protein